MPATHASLITPQSAGGAAYLAAVAFFAADRHKLQRRKGVNEWPYINHPLAVANVLVEAGETDPETLAAAIGHDLVEDTETTAEELAQRFGVAMRDLVLECSDDKSLPYAARKQSQIDYAPHASFRAGKIKLADKIVNLRDLATETPPNWGGERVGVYFDWALAVATPLLAKHPALGAVFEEAYALKSTAIEAADRLLAQHRAAHGSRRGML